MAKVTPISEHFQHFLAEMKETFWGDLYGETKLAWQRFFELQSERQRDRFSGAGRYERRQGRRRVYRNGYYERDFVTRLGTIRLRIARTREKSFLPCGLERFQRRAEEVSMLIREAFLRGISTRQVGRVVAILTGEVGSAQTVSKLTRDLDEAVRQFHQARLSDDYAYLFLDGVSLRVRRRQDVSGYRCWWPMEYGRRHSSLAGLPAQSGRKSGGLGRIAAGSVSPRIAGPEPAVDRHRRLSRFGGGDSHRVSPGPASALLVHKMRNILEKVRKSDYEEVKAGAQAMYLAENRAKAEAAFRRFRARWRPEYGSMMRRLERDLPELLSFFAFPRHLWRKLRTTTVIERCFVEVRRRTRPMVCFVNVESVNRIIYSIFQRFNLEWKTRTLSVFTQAA